MDPEVREELLREELSRVLSSACFAHSDGVSKLLRFLVERHIEGRDDALKESVIGVEVFGRRPDYDPKLDSTVRTAAVRLRARLGKYYSTEGSQDPFEIEVPKGGYVPRFRPRAVPPRHAAGSRRLWLSAGLAGAAIVTIATGVLWARRVQAPIPIAVLPLMNLSEDSRNEYFADGLTDEIIRNLSIIDGLSVRSQTSSFALKGKPRNLQEVGNQLKVDYVVEGSVARSGQQVRIDAQLVRVRDDVPVWAGKVEREFTDVITIQDEISRGIVNGLRLKLGRGRRRYEIGADAYELYLRARAAENQMFPGSPEVIALFEQAIGKDSSFAPAYAGLANAYAWRSFQGFVDPVRADALDKMRAAAEKALELDPLLPEAHSALGAAHARNAEWELAERSFRRAIEIDPNASTARQAYMTFVLWPLGRLDEAVQEARAAERNDPLSQRAHASLGGVLLAAGRYDEAASQCEQLPPDLAMFKECAGRVWLAQAQPEKAIPVLATNPAHNWGYLAYAYERAGRRADAEKLAAEAPTLYPNRRGPFQYALVYAGLRDTDRTIEQLGLMADVVGPVRMGFTLNSPEFAFVSGDPRTKALRHKIGLPEQH
jgi:TolB-like protein